MEKGRYIHGLRVTGVILLCTIVAFSYTWVAEVLFENTANKHWKGKRYHARKSNRWNITVVDSCSRLLTTGDLVVRRGDDMTSYMLSKMNGVDKRYSHCGVVTVENGIAYVYHSIGGEDNPDQVMKKERAERWFSPANNLAFAVYRYELADSNIDLLLKYVEKYYQQKTMFDMDFDLKTDDRLYCSEMVYKAMLAATDKKLIVPEKLAYGNQYVSIDDLYAQAKLVCQIKFK